MPKAPRAIPSPAAAPTQTRKGPTKPPKAPQTLKEILFNKIMNIVREMRYGPGQHIERKRESLLSIGTEGAAGVDVADFFTAFEAKVYGVVDAFETSTDPFVERLARLLDFWEEVEKIATALYGKGGLRSFTPARAIEALELVYDGLADAHEDDVSIVKEMFELTDAQRLDTAADRMQEWILGLLRNESISSVCEKITAKADEVLAFLPINYADDEDEEVDDEDADEAATKDESTKDAGSSE